MTDEQLKILRELIKAEVELALQNENGYMWAFEQEKSNDQGWETFKETFK